MNIEDAGAGVRYAVNKPLTLLPGLLSLLIFDDFSSQLQVLLVERIFYALNKLLTLLPGLLGLLIFDDFFPQLQGLLVKY